VYLNIYDLSPANDCLYPTGLGIHHSGVEVLGSEYAFGSGGGIFDQTPKEIPNGGGGGVKFRESVWMGSIEGGSSQLNGVIEKLRKEFKADNYNILTRNCNHFANALVYALLGRQIPPYVNRIATIGGMVSCLIPKKMLESAPVGDSQSTSSSSSSSSSGFQMYGGGGRSNNSGGGGGVVGGETMSRSFQGSSGTKLGSGSSSTNNSISSSSSTTNNGGLGGGIQTLLGRTTLLVGGGASSSDHNRGTDDLIDRRERARKAALARFDNHQHQPQHQQQITVNGGARNTND